MPNAASGPGVSTHVRQYMLLGTYTTVCKRTFLRNTDAETPKQMLAGTGTLRASIAELCSFNSFGNETWSERTRTVVKFGRKQR